MSVYLEELKGRRLFEEVHSQLSDLDMVIKQANELTKDAHLQLQHESFDLNTKAKLYGINQKISYCENLYRSLEENMNNAVGSLDSIYTGFTKKVYEADVEQILNSLVRSKQLIRELKNQVRNIENVIFSRPRENTSAGAAIVRLILFFIFFSIILIVITAIFDESCARPSGTSSTGRRARSSSRSENSRTGSTSNGRFGAENPRFSFS